MMQRAFTDGQVDTKAVATILASMGVQDVRNCFMSRSEFARAFRIAEPTLRRWLDRYEVGYFQFNTGKGKTPQIWIPKLPVLTLMHSLCGDLKFPQQVHIGPQLEQAPPNVQARITQLELEVDELKSQIRKLVHAQ